MQLRIMPSARVSSRTRKVKERVWACTEQQSGRATSGGSTGAAPRRVGSNVGDPVKVVLSAWPVHIVTKGLTRGSPNEGLACQRGT